MTNEQIQQFKELETSLHKKEVRNSPERVAELIDDDFNEFSKSGGVFNKHDTLVGLAGEQLDLQIEVSDFNVRELSAAVVLVTYTASMLDTDNVTIVTTRRSSIWINRDGRWQMMFHQGTKVL